MRILILGAGWVGEYAAYQWRECGYEVWVTTTTVEKYHRFRGDGIFAILYNFDLAHAVPAELPDSFDFILNSVPATKKLSRMQLETRFENLSEFCLQLTYEKLVFLSSIGVYPDANCTYTEDAVIPDPDTNHLYYAEQTVLALGNTLVYRLGGLFGQSRIFAKYFQNKICTTGAQPANFVHLVDVYALINAARMQQLQQVIYNVVCPIHPSKRAVIIASAKKYNMALPSAFEDDPKEYLKVVSGLRLAQELEYTFVYPSPLNF